MSKFGARTGDPFGDVKNLRATPVAATMGGGYRLTWQFSADPDAWYKVFLNRVEGAVVDDNYSTIYPEDDELSTFEVLAVGPGNRFADYSHLMEAVYGNKVRLTWLGSDSPDAESYNIYNDDRTGTMDYGTVVANVPHQGGGVTHYWKSGELAEGTWKFGVRCVDEAGNEETNTTTVTVVIDTYPHAVTNLAYSWDDVLKKVTLTWTGSTSSDVDKYRIYTNGGSGFVDYTTVVAEVSDPTATWTSAAIATPGTYNYGVRAVDTGGKEERNTDRVVSIELVGTPPSEEPDLPNAPHGLEATAIAGAKVQLDWLYDQEYEEATPDTFNVYYDNGTGTVSYAAPLDTVAWSAGSASGRYRAFTWLSGALTDGTTYKFVVRAEASGDEESNTVEVSATADSTTPAAPSSLTGAARN